MDIKILKALGFVVVRKEQPDLTVEGLRDIKLKQITANADSIVDVFENLTIGDLEDLEQMTGLTFDEIVAEISGDVVSPEPAEVPKAPAEPKQPQDRKQSQARKPKKSSAKSA